MKTLRNSLMVLLVAIVSTAGFGQSTLALVEDTSDAGCGDGTNCANEVICLNIVLTPAVTATLQSYNIWLQYPDIGIHYLSDAACITSDGNDNNQDVNFGWYRVAGITGTTTVTAGLPVVIHNVCFTYNDLDSIDLQTMFVGGTFLGAIFTTITYNNPPSNEPMVPAFPFELNSTTITCLDVLPLKLLSFTAQKRDGMSDLTWTTTEEVNTLGFEIERSVNGRDFVRIGMVPSSGESAGIHSYSFTDITPHSGINYYRLRIVDHDGRFTNSEIRNLVFERAGYVVKAMPNPIGDDMLTVEVYSPDQGEQQIRLISVSGHEVYSGILPAGETKTDVDMGTFSPGVYTLIVSSPAGTWTEKIVVLD
jgi:hypothetical protein